MQSLATRTFSHKATPPVLIVPSMYNKGVEGTVARKLLRETGKTTVAEIIEETNRAPDGAQTELGDFYDWEDVLDPSVREIGQHPMLCTYAHYGIESGEMEPLPRLKADTAHTGQLGVAGKSIMCNYIFIDVDPWKKVGGWPSMAARREALESVRHLDGIGGKWCAFYTTANGYRVVYALQRPLHPREFKGKASGVLRELAAQQVYEAKHLDETCNQWSRLVRPPFFQGEDDDDILVDMRDRLLHPDDVPTVMFPDRVQSDVGELVEGLASDRRTPTAGSQNSILWNYDNSLTDIGLAVKRKLRNTAFFGYVFGTALPDVGSRDTVINDGVGDTIGKLIRLPEVTPELIFALWEPCVAQFPNDEGSDWMATLWEKITRYWSKDTAKLHDEAQIRLHMAEARSQRQDDAAARYQTNQPDSELRHLIDPEERQEWIKRHSILCIGGRYHFLNPDRGVYGTTGMGAEIASSRPGREIEPYGRTFSDRYIDLDSGKEKQLQWAQVKHERCIVVDSMRVDVVRPGGKRGTTLSIEDGAHIAEYRHAGRREFEAKHSADVEEWLRLLAPGREEALQQWLAYALAMDEGPICALAMIGHGGSGKSILARELGRCLGDSCWDGRDWFGGASRFTDGLEDAGVITLEENFTLMRGVDASARMRSIVSHESVKLEPKGMSAKTYSTVPYRLVITANSESMMRQIIMKAKSTHVERTATAQRILILRPGKAASNHIDSTKIDHWIKTDAVPKHLTWLYERRGKWTAGERFLVEGQTDSSIDRMLWLDTEGNYVTLYAILNSIWQSRGCHRADSSRKIAETYGVSFSKDGRIFLEVGPIGEAVNEKLSRVTQANVITVIKDMAIGCDQSPSSTQYYYNVTGTDMAEAPMHMTSSARIAVSLDTMIKLAKLADHELALGLLQAQRTLLQEL
jgi:hypothetical protein